MLRLFPCRRVKLTLKTSQMTSFSTTMGGKFMTSGIQSYLQKICDLHENISTQLASPDINSSEISKLQKKQAQYTLLSESFDYWKRKSNELEDTKKLLLQGEKDSTMIALFKEELEGVKEEMDHCETQLKVLLLASDSNDQSSAIMEIRAGTGGEEAALFAGEMLGMYKNYAYLKGWELEILDQTLEGSSGIREASISISGNGVFGRLKYESGVHRVQRVPKTDSLGRVHTSTMTVAILPQHEDITVEICDKDLRIDSFKSSGPGGQNVNKVNSAIRVVHIPTGIIVAVQEERCAEQNRVRAMMILKSKLYEAKRMELENSRNSARASQIGQAARSDKIRTYNFPQSRITDHRIGLSIHGMESFFTGSHLDLIIDQLKIQDDKEKLESFEIKENY